MTILSDERGPIKTTPELPSPYFLWRKLTYVSRGDKHYSYTYWVLMRYLQKGSGIHEVFKPQGFLGRVDKMSREKALELAWDRIGDDREGVPIQEAPIDIEVIEIKPEDAENLTVEIEGKVIGGYCSHRAAHCHYLENEEFCLCDQKYITELESCRFMARKEVVA